jgi:hypothetical protein
MIMLGIIDVLIVKLGVIGFCVETLVFFYKLLNWLEGYGVMHSCPNY